MNDSLLDVWYDVFSSAGKLHYCLPQSNLNEYLGLYFVPPGVMMGLISTNITLKEISR